jgi:hypothetical protein
MQDQHPVRGDDADPGFTWESLRKLDSAEGQRNAVFACFGPRHHNSAC